MRVRRHNMSQHEGRTKTQQHEGLSNAFCDRDERDRVAFAARETLGYEHGWGSGQPARGGSGRLLTEEAGSIVAVPVADGQVVEMEEQRRAVSGRGG